MDPQAPAEGERRAASGYSNQYRVAAFLVYRALCRGELTAIRVADVDAGRVDDLQILRAGRIDAYQVKWSLYAESLTFKGLRTPEADKPSLIGQLGDGWKLLRGRNAGTRVVVHLLTNDRPSVGDRPPVGTPAPSPDHFAAFLAQAWDPACRAVPSDPLAVPAGWRPAWDDLQKESGLVPDEFAAFVRDCELEVSYTLPEIDAPLPGERATVERDRNDLAHFLFTTVGGTERLVELTRAELLRRLGWESRFRPVNHHQWPPGPLLYQPVASTATELARALDTLTEGYVALLGTPGSGKSTLLTETLRARRERVVSYYAYVPDARCSLRGEAVSFLHDVVLALDDQGFRSGGPTAPDRTQLLGRLHRQLELLNADFLATGRKTILLIDGLDHIEREERPERSLLADLPAPEQVPDGVVILLGSQTDELADLPSGVQFAIRDPARRVVMQVLDRDAVFRIVDAAGLPVPLDADQRERVFALSEGHPLALTYLLARLRSVSSREAVAPILAGTAPYGGRIEREYHSYWRTLGSEPEITRLLGLLARLRPGIDLGWVQTWAGTALVDRLRQSAGHYFREDGDRWYFHHNSFRLFLEARTAERSPGRRDEVRDQDLHRELAGHCAAAGDGEWAWEELYHLSRAGDHAAVLARATQEYFRRQVEALRPLDAVATDIRLALLSAAGRQDPVALARLVLAHGECDGRASYLDDVPLASLLLDIGQPGAAVQHARDGNRLRTGATQALRLSGEFVDAGLREEGLRMFRLAEPHGLLNSIEPVDEWRREGVLDVLRAWATAVADFRPVAEIVAAVRRLRQHVDDHEEVDPDTATRLLHNRLLLDAGLRLLHTRRWTESDDVAAAFDPHNPTDRDWRLVLFVEGAEAAHKAGDTARARELLAAANGIAEAVPDLDSGIRLDLAEAAFRIRDDREAARRLLDAVSPPGPIATDGDHRGQDDPVFWFRVARLQYAFGDRRPLRELVPDPTTSDAISELEVEVARDFCRIGRLWARAWLGDPANPGEIPALVAGVVRRFRRDPNDCPPALNDRHAALLRTRRTAYRYLIRAIAGHGREAVAVLRGEFEREWSEQRRFWPIELRRAVVEELADAGDDRGWVLDELGRLEASLLDDANIYERVRLCREQAEAHLSVGHREGARVWLCRLVRTAAGVGSRKDYQMNDWIGWLGRIVPLDPGRAAERVAWYARAIAALRERTEGEFYRAAESLLGVAVTWSPVRAVRLMNWLFSHQVLSHRDAVDLFLGAAFRTRPAPLALGLAFATEILPIITVGPDSGVVDALFVATHVRGGSGDVEDAARGLLEGVGRMLSRPRGPAGAGASHTRFAPLGCSPTRWG